MRRSSLFRTALACAALVAAFAAEAQAPWPSRPIKLVVGFAAGGSTDVTARLIAQALSERLGQQVIVENRGGAGGNIGADAVAKAEPDGYTLLLTTSTTHATNPSLYKSLPFDVRKDFAPITLTAFIPNLLVIHPSVPATTIDELVAYAKANPDKLTYGSAGNGSSQHLSAELFKSLAGIRMTHAPYRGGAPAVTDLLAGNIQVLFAPLVEVLQHVEDGRLKALGVTTAKRSPLLPNAPAIGERLPGYEVALWNGLLGPAKLPKDIVERVNKEAVASLRSDDLKAKLAKQGSEPVGNTPDEFRAFIEAELVKWKKLVEISGAQVQ
ncbi:tripartite tricarboxylate transporter substrate binding protein [Enterovirga rhinocerotis]|uniref:Tripartite-type tricarboxylate transporter receptor subunit TctC n=1 Tax=Enterovirga rhinocerotis TaxID=1339210 RepID=A0A4V3DXY4_9HYPH|nr:tripartite tricarboxylate transporter substrate binding protein [Enterovirga rhinocerotis]TDR90499.1 tripartite-type tricarboxylate transporter receptor subunit TctC [Enterovirga rhinocerotis]